MNETHDLALILESRIPIVVVDSADERRVLDLLTRFAISHQLSYYVWTATQGLRRGGFGPDFGAEWDLTDPEEALRQIFTSQGPALYAMCDFHPYFKESHLVVRLSKDIALDYERLQNTLVFISHHLDLPTELSRLSASLDLALPSDQQLMAIVREQAQEWSNVNGGARVRTDNRTLERLIANLRGVTHSDARVLVRHAIFRDGAIQESDLPEINRLKFELLDQEGVLRFEYETEQFAGVAGLNNLKHWLDQRRTAFVSKEADFDRPRGILLLGVQGSGKSLAARCVAGYWGLPLLRLDVGSLYNKFHGETERNLRNTLKQAEMMAPCVMWLDEIEKGLAVGQGDNATSQRLLGTLLTWMAERDADVFTVATSNDISKLPPELLRKGRMDEIFFVDLPDKATRHEIFRIHLEKRDVDAAGIDLELLAELSTGFTGAEIEQAVVSARYGARSSKKSVDTELLRDAIEGTYPISVVMAEQIAALRDWARNRTVPA